MRFELQTMSGSSFHFLFLFRWPSNHSSFEKGTEQRHKLLAKPCLAGFISKEIK